MLPGLDEGGTEVARQKTAIVAETPSPNEHKPADYGIRYLQQIAEEAESAKASRPRPPAPLDADENHGLEIVQHIPLGEIRAFAGQARADFSGLAELAASIKEHGVLQPILVRYAPRPDRTNYELIAGERRLRASEIAGRERIPAIVQEIDDTAAMEVSMLENLQRKDLNPIEEARGYRTYLDKTGKTQAELGKKVGKSQSAVANGLRLLECPEQVQAQVISGDITAYHARLLLGLRPDAQKAGNQWLDGVGNFDAAMIWAKANGWTSTQLERAIRLLNKRTEDALAREQIAESVKCEIAERLAKLRESGVTAVQATSEWQNPDGLLYLPVLQRSYGRSNLTCAACSDCADLVTVTRPSGKVGTLCSNATCNAQRLVELRERETELAGVENGLTAGNQSRVLAGLTPTEKARVALYLHRTRSMYYDQKAQNETWAALPTDVDAEEVVAAVVTESLPKIVTEVLASSDHRSLRAWIAERFEIDPGWILGRKAKAASTTDGEAEPEVSEAGTALVCRECGRTDTGDDLEEDWAEDDLCVECAERLGLAGDENADGGQAEGAEAYPPTPVGDNSRSTVCPTSEPIVRLDLEAARRMMEREGNND